MNNDVREYLAGYVDGELTESERIEFEEQLDRDPRLRAELDEFRKLKEVTGMIRSPIFRWRHGKAIGRICTVNWSEAPDGSFSLSAPLA